MWSRHSLRRSSLALFRGTDRDKTRSRRDRRRPRLEVLEDRQLLSIAGALQFDFGPASGYADAPGYIAATNAAFSSATGHGWQSPSTIWTGANWWPNPNPVTTDVAYAVNNTFTVDLPNGTYTVVPTLGSYGSSQSQVSLSLNGQQAASGLATVAAQFISPAYQVTVTSGQLAVNLQDMAGKYFWLDALSILPGQVAPPTASAGAAITVGVGSPASFAEATATGAGPLSSSWYFGDYGKTSGATTSTGSLDPSHVYTTAGTYTAMLTVTDANGIVVASPVTVNVIASPTASAGVNQTVNEESPVTFAGSMSGGVAPYTETWSFGDGIAATGTLTPTHVYTDPGIYTATLTVTDASRASSSSSVVETVNDIPPTVNIGGSYQGHAGSPVAFSATASDVNPTAQSDLTYTWNFGDGTTGTGPDPSHVFTRDGIYDIALAVTDPYGGSTMATTQVEVFPSVSAGLDPTIDVGSPVLFQGTAVGSSSFTYAWNFGDGTTASTLDPTHAYLNAGTYTATFTATDPAGLSASATVEMIVVNVPPTVTLGAPSDAAMNVPVGLTATATDPSASDQAAGYTYSWNFGDGTAAAGADPSHAFSQPGTYTVSVTATDSLGQKGTATASVDVTGLPTFHIDFGPSTAAVATGYTGVATPAFSTTSGYGWQTSTVYAGANYWAGSNPVIADFTYAVNNTFTVDLPNGTYTVVPTLGSYGSSQSQVSLSLNGQQAASGLATAAGQFISPAYSVTVTGGQLAVHLQDMAGKYFWLDALSILPGQIAPPTASAGAAITVGVGSPASFAGATATGASPLSYSWNFGDGSSGSGALNLTHTYSTVGTYTALLTCTDANDLVVASPVTVTVNNVPPTATITAPSIGAVNAPLSFAATAKDPSATDQAAGYTYAWNFGDGTTAAGADPSHTYASAGDYTVSVTATDSLGQKGTATAVVDVFVPPTVSAGQPITVDAGSSVTFAQATATGAVPLAYSWSFGDGTGIIGLLNPAHVYETPGTYSATLTVVDTHGLVTTGSVGVTVVDVAPTASINVPATGTVGQPIDFSTGATDVSPVVQADGFTYAWNFGDGTTGTGVTPAHTYSAPGTYSVSVTATDEDGTTSTKAVGSIVVSAPAVGSTVNITSSWLQQQGAGPYVLAQANTTYVLQTNVTTVGSAFVVLAPNVTLNLNGYTVTYGNSASITVPNSGFESGSGTNVPDWNIAGAPSASLVPNTMYLFGNQVLQLTNFSTAQTIVSSPIPISLVDHTYEATITPANPGMAYGTTVTLNVIDAVTGQVLGTGESANPSRGFSAVAAFTPATTDPVLLQVVVTPPAGTTTTIDLDAAALNVSDDYGIIASRWWSGDLHGFGNLPASVQTLYSAHYQSVSNFTVENGTISQGQGDGPNSSPLFLEQINGVTVNDVTTHTVGVDTTDVELSYASGNITIVNSTFQDDIPNVSDRMEGPASIQLFDTAGNTLIEGNRILGSPQFGIQADTNNGYTLDIDDNDISQDAHITNAYAILIVADSNFQVVGNTIVPILGEGIIVDGYRGTPSNDGVIQDNYVDVQEAPNREYGLGKTYARALNLRNYDGPANAAETNIDISGNTFIANAGPGYTLYANAVWLTYINPVGTMDDANIDLHNNIIEAIANSTSSSYHVNALEIDEMAPGINLTISDNILASNDTSLALGGYNNGNVTGITFIGNTLDRLTSNVPSRPYTGIEVGYFTSEISDIEILDTQLENGATATIVWEGSGTKSDIEVGSTLDFQVLNPDGTAAAGASVSIYDAAGDLVYQGTTDASGDLSDVVVIATTSAQAGSNPSMITTTSSGLFTVDISNGTQKTSLIIDPSTGEDTTIVDTI